MPLLIQLTHTAYCSLWVRLPGLYHYTPVGSYVWFGLRHGFHEFLTAYRRMAWTPPSDAFNAIARTPTLLTSPDTIPHTLPDGSHTFAFLRFLYNRTYWFFTVQMDRAVIVPRPVPARHSSRRAPADVPLPLMPFVQCSLLPFPLTPCRTPPLPQHNTNWLGSTTADCTVFGMHPSSYACVSRSVLPVCYS